MGIAASGRAPMMEAVKEVKANNNNNFSHYLLFIHPSAAHFFFAALSRLLSNNDNLPIHKIRPSEQCASLTKIISTPAIARQASSD